MCNAAQRYCNSVEWQKKCSFFAVFYKNSHKNFVAYGKNTTFAPANETIGVWCNGNTTDSGPVILGSSPSTPTKSTTKHELISMFSGFLDLICKALKIKAVGLLDILLIAPEAQVSVVIWLLMGIK